MTAIHSIIARVRIQLLLHRTATVSRVGHHGGSCILLDRAEDSRSRTRVRFVTSKAPDYPPHGCGFSFQYKVTEAHLQRILADVDPLVVGFNWVCKLAYFSHPPTLTPGVT